jgi:hypothetical protein
MPYANSSVSKPDTTERERLSCRPPKLTRWAARQQRTYTLPRLEGIQASAWVFGWTSTDCGDRIGQELLRFSRMLSNLPIAAFHRSDGVVKLLESSCQRRGDSDDVPVAEGRPAVCGDRGGWKRVDRASGISVWVVERRSLPGQLPLRLSQQKAPIEMSRGRRHRAPARRFRFDPKPIATAGNSADPAFAGCSVDC